MGLGPRVEQRQQKETHLYLELTTNSIRIKTSANLVEEVFRGEKQMFRQH